MVYIRRKNRLIESNAICRHLKEFSCEGILLQVIICLKSPPLLRFCLGWYMCIQYTYSHMGRGEGGELTREKVRGATVQKAGSKIAT
jgi:hypothetical protein